MPSARSFPSNLACSQHSDNPQRWQELPRRVADLAVSLTSSLFDRLLAGPYRTTLCQRESAMARVVSALTTEAKTLFYELQSLSLA